MKEIAAKHKVIVVDFHATWCGPCKRIAPYVHTKSDQTGVVVVKVDVDQNGEAAQHYNVQAMPTFHVLDRTGTSIFTKTGGSEAVVNEIFQFALNKTHQ